MAQRAASPFWSSASQPGEPARRRTWLLYRPRAQRTCILVAHLSYFLNTCGDLPATSPAFYTCSKNTSISKVGKYLGKRWSNRFQSSATSTYFSNTCANKSADRRVVFETITSHRRRHYLSASWDRMLCFCKSVYFSNTCAKYKS